jgi:predicted ester cyclase
MMTDDFTFSGPVPEPIDAQGFIGLMQALGAAMPDWTYQARDFRAEGPDRVACTVTVGGTHTGTLSLPPLGVSDLAPTGIAARNPDETVHLTVRGDQIANVHTDVPPDGGVAGILRQLGVDVPA